MDLAYRSFSVAYLAKRHSTTPHEQVRGEIKPHTEVAGIFPTEADITRLVGNVLLEQNDEWVLQRVVYMTRETMNEMLKPPALDLFAIRAQKIKSRPASGTPSDQSTKSRVGTRSVNIDNIIVNIVYTRAIERVST